jgi:lysophospholipase L1-like esterase
VILQYGWNDRRTSRGFTDRQVMRMLPLMNSPWVKAVMQTALYRTFAWTADALLPKPPQDPKGIDRDLDPVVDNSRMRVPLAESIENYRRMIDVAREADARVIIILPPYRPSVPGLGPRMKDFHREIAAAFRDKATFLPLPAMREASPDLDSYFDSDGIHPNLRGVAYIADAIADAIARAVRSDGTVVEASAAAPPRQVAGSP